MPLGQPREFEVEAIGEPSLPRPDHEEVLAFQIKLGKLHRSVTGAQRVVDESLEALKEIKNLIKEGRMIDLALLDEARELELKLTNARESLSGDPTKTRRGATGAPSIARRIGTALFGTLNNTNGPTKTHQRQYDIAREEYEETIESIRQAVETDLQELMQKLDEAGAPWTKSRKIPRLDED